MMGHSPIEEALQGTINKGLLKSLKSAQHR